MNAQVELGLLQREGCTAIRVTGWPPKSKPRKGENVLGDTAASREAVRRGACEGSRRGLDDDPARHDEAGALKFMERVRNTALALSYNIAVAIFGGFAQFIATFLIQITGSKQAPALYVMGAAIVTLVILLKTRERAFQPLG